MWKWGGAPFRLRNKGEDHAQIPSWRAAFMPRLAAPAMAQGQSQATEINVFTPAVVWNAGLQDIAADYTKKTGVKVTIKNLNMGKIVGDIRTGTPVADVIDPAGLLHGRHGRDGRHRARHRPGYRPRHHRPGGQEGRPASRHLHARQAGGGAEGRRHGDLFRSGQRQHGSAHHQRHAAPECRLQGRQGQDQHQGRGRPGA